MSGCTCAPSTISEHFEQIIKFYVTRDLFTKVDTHELNGNLISIICKEKSKEYLESGLEDSHLEALCNDLTQLGLRRMNANNLYRKLTESQDVLYNFYSGQGEQMFRAWLAEVEKREKTLEDELQNIKEIKGNAIGNWQAVMAEGKTEGQKFFANVNGVNDHVAKGKCKGEGV